MTRLVLAEKDYPVLAALMARNPWGSGVHEEIRRIFHEVDNLRVMQANLAVILPSAQRKIDRLRTHLERMRVQT